MVRSKEKSNIKTHLIFFGCVFIFAFLFFGKPVLAAPQIVGEYQFSGGGGGSSQFDIEVYNPDSQGSLVIIHFRTFNGGCYSLPSITLDGSSLSSRLINTTDGKDEGFYGIFWSSLLDGRHTIIVGAAACTIKINAFALSGVDYSRVPEVITLDRGGNWGNPSLTGTISSSSMSQVGTRGLGIDIMGSWFSAPSTFTAGSGETIISNPASSTMAVGAQFTPTTANGSYTMNFTATNLTGYHYFLWVPLIATTSEQPELPPEQGSLIDTWYTTPVGCEDVGVITPFYPSQGADGFNYDVYASSTCAGNEVASGTYISYLGGVFDDTFYLPPPITWGIANYCMYAHFDQTPQIEDYAHFTVNWLASTSASCDISILMDQYNTYCGLPCYGIATSTNPLDLNNFNCGLRKFGCWLTVVDRDTIDVFGRRWDAMTRRFPLAPVTKLIDDLALIATGTQAIGQGTILLPQWSTSSAEYQGVSYDLGSSTWKGSHGDIKFRRFQVIGMWTLLCALPIVLTIIFLIV